MTLGRVQLSFPDTFVLSIVLHFGRNSSHTITYTLILKMTMDTYQLNMSNHIFLHDFMDTKYRMYPI